MSYLTSDGLTKDFGGHRAVDGLTWKIEKGEFILLLGPFGCGKTTVLQMIAGQRKQPSGGGASFARPGHQARSDR